MVFFEAPSGLGSGGASSFTGMLKGRNTLDRVYEDRDRGQIIPNWQFATGEDCATCYRELMLALFALPPPMRRHGVDSRAITPRAERCAAIVRETDGLEASVRLIVTHPHNGAEAESAGFGGKEEVLGHPETSTIIVEMVYIRGFGRLQRKSLAFTEKLLYHHGMLTPEQSRAARGWLDWSQEALAKAANVSLSTVRDFEKGRREPIANNKAAIERALNDAGVQMTYQDDVPVGIEVGRRSAVVASKAHGAANGAHKSPRPAH